MRIGVDIRCLQHAWRTGVGEVTWQTLRALRTLPSVELVGLANAVGELHLPPDIDNIMEVVGTHVPNRLKNLMLYWSLGEPLDTALSKQGKPVDVFWLPNPNFAFFSGRVPVVLTLHDLSFLHMPYFFPRRGRLWYFPAVRRLLQHGLPARSAVVAVSQHTSEDTREQFHALAGKMKVIYPGVAPEYFHELDQAQVKAVRGKYGLSDQILLSVGTVEPRKNYQLLLQTYDELVRVRPDYPYDLVIAGGWGWRSGGLKKMYECLPSKDRIHFVGYVSEDEKRALYALATIFLYPSFYEGFGLPPLEAMAAGVPVVVSHASSLPEVVGNAGVLLNPRQPRDWFQTLQWLSYDTVERERLGELGRARARAFTWERAAKSYYELFESLCI